MSTTTGADAETAATTRPARAAAPFSLAGLSSATPPAPARGARRLQAGPVRQRPAADAHHQADRGISPADDLGQLVKNGGPAPAGRPGQQDRMRADATRRCPLPPPPQ